MLKVFNNSLELLTKRFALQTNRPVVVQHLLTKRGYSSGEAVGSNKNIMEKFDLPKRLQGSAPSVW